MSDARKRAEEALAKWDGCRVCRTWKPARAHSLSLAMALRALLAEEPEAPSSRRCQCADPDHCAADEAPKVPLPPEVREAAERLKATYALLGALDEKDFLRSFRVMEVLLPRLMRETRDLLSALDARGGA